MNTNFTDRFPVPKTQQSNTYKALKQHTLAMGAKMVVSGNRSVRVDLVPRFRSILNKINVKKLGIFKTDDFESPSAILLNS